MLKKIDNVLYLTGTSVNSLYPVVVFEEIGGKNGTFLALGMRAEFEHAGSNPVMGVYTRAQTFPLKDGVPAMDGDYTLNMAAVADKLSGFEFKVGSSHHLSTTLAGAVLPIFNTDASASDKADAASEAMFEIARKIAKNGKMTRLRSAMIKKLVRERYAKVFKVDLSPPKPAVIDLPDVDDQLDGAFDFLSMLGKPKPNS